MATFRIVRKSSGAEMGEYQAADQYAALMAMCADASSDETPEGGPDGWADVWSVEAKVECACGELTGEKCQAEVVESNLVTVAYIPDAMMGSARAARDTDPETSDFAENVRIAKSCADVLARIDEEEGGPVDFVVVEE